MANARKANVWVIDTAAQFDEELHIQGIKVVNGNGSAQTSTIKIGGSGGTTVYTQAVTANSEEYEDICLRVGRGEQLYVTPGTTCTVYLYLE